MAELDDARTLLRRLQGRLVAGEIDEGMYQRQRDMVLADLSVEERESLGITPTPMPEGTPHPVGPSEKPRLLGPSGARGSGMETRLERLADLEIKAGDVLLDKFRIVRELGRGGFGAVFEAEEVRLGDRLAVKVLDPAMVARVELLARFRREVQLMRKLVHPHIARVYDYDEDLGQGVALIAMEYVSGGSVLDLHARSGKEGTPFPAALALAILEQALEALAEAHTHGVIHRDVTPANLLLAGNAEDLVKDPTRDPQVKLIDFGIAGLVERSELSQKSRALGTAAYVAPEVLDPRVEVTSAADIYGAGAVAYYLLTDALPLGRFKAPAECRGDIDRRTSDLILRLLETRPEDRPTAAEGKSAVGEILGAMQRGAVEAQARANKITTLRARLAQAVAATDEGAAGVAVRDLGRELGEGTARIDEDVQRAAAWLEERARVRREIEARRAEEERSQLREKTAAQRAEERRRELSEAVPDFGPGVATRIPVARSKRRVVVAVFVAVVAVGTAAIFVKSDRAPAGSPGVRPVVSPPVVPRDLSSSPLDQDVQKKMLQDLVNSQVVRALKDKEDQLAQELNVQRAKSGELRRQLSILAKGDRERISPDKMLSLQGELAACEEKQKGIEEELVRVKQQRKAEVAKQANSGTKGAPLVGGGGPWGVAVDGGCQPAELERLYRRQEADKVNLRVAPFGRGDGQCYRLTWGHFPTKEAAEEAMSHLPEGLSARGFPPHVVRFEGGTP